MQPIEELRYLILAAQREGNRMFTEALRPLNLTSSQAEVLRVLQEHQPLSLVALGGMLICESGSPSRLVNGLVEGGYIKRIPSKTSGRQVTLTLTPKGTKMAEHVAAVEAEFYAIFGKTLGDTSMTESLDLLRRFVEGRPAGEALKRRK